MPQPIRMPVSNTSASIVVGPTALAVISNTMLDVSTGGAESGDVSGMEPIASTAIDVGGVNAGQILSCVPLVPTRIVGDVDRADPVIERRRM